MKMHLFQFKQTSGIDGAEFNPEDTEAMPKLQPEHHCSQQYLQSGMI